MNNPRVKYSGVAFRIKCMKRTPLILVVIAVVSLTDAKKHTRTPLELVNLPGGNFIMGNNDTQTQGRSVVRICCLIH